MLAFTLILFGSVDILFFSLSSILISLYTFGASIIALTLVYVTALTLLRVAMTRIGFQWIEQNLFALCFPYVLLAAWLGDVWEALSAVTISAAFTAWLTVAGVSPIPGNPYLIGEMPDSLAWFLYAASAIAIVGLAHRRRGVTPQNGIAAPVVSADMDSPVLVIHGNVQVLQGGGVVFDSREQLGATPQPVAVKGRHILR